MVRAGHDGDAETAAEAYDRLLVPAMMAPWAARLADAARIAPGDRVLDVACGTGALTGEALRRVGLTGAVTGLDPNPEMLAVARRRVPEADLREGRTEELPFADADFDVVTCSFGLMFFTDRGRALREMVRVLRPGGRLALSVWADLPQSPAYSALVATIERHAGAEAAALVRAPFSLGDVPGIRALLGTVPLSAVEVSLVDEPTRFPSVATWVAAEVEGWVRFAGAPAGDVTALLADAERTLSAYERPDGTAEFALPAIIATGRA